MHQLSIDLLNSSHRTNAEYNDHFLFIRNIPRTLKRTKCIDKVLRSAAKFKVHGTNNFRAKF